MIKSNYPHQFAKVASITCLAALALTASACKTTRPAGHKASPATTYQPKKAQAQTVASIAHVDENAGFVLLQTSGYNLPAGQQLSVVHGGKEIAKVTVAADRKQPFVAADISEGLPVVGANALLPPAF